MAALWLKIDTPIIFLTSNATMSDFETCPCCKYGYTKKAEKVAHKRASQRAHNLAMKEAESEDARFTFLELYGMFFPRIYKHEYDRELDFEREKQQLNIQLKPENADRLCSYHGEFTNTYNIDIFKEVKIKYDKGKWKLRPKRT